MTAQRRGISKNPESSRQASSWRGNVITLLLLTGVTGLVSWMYFTWTDDLTPRVFTVECSEDYKKYKLFPVYMHKYMYILLLFHRLAERGLSLAGSDGGVSKHFSIQMLQFVNIYRYFKNEIRDVFTEDFELYRDVCSRIQKAIAETFGLDTKQIYLTKPTFFSRINSTSAKNTHDEYWHPHIDKETYGSFDYTSLLYLSDYGLEFGGGRFVFMDPSSNRTVKPRAGRVSFFSSGSENLHHVEKVPWGTRYAITVSFTCDPNYAIDNPSLP
uniref:Urotensin-2 receptor 2 n=1 Tax=Sinocyclocheilus anshuiensis TaxID=1608454 RepID=A0A671SFJ4_9TELE